MHKGDIYTRVYMKDPTMTLFLVKISKVRLNSSIQPRRSSGDYSILQSDSQKVLILHGIHLYVFQTPVQLHFASTVCDLMIRMTSNNRHNAFYALYTTYTMHDTV